MLSNLMPNVSFFKKFYEDENEDHITLLFHTEENWQATIKLF